MSNRILCHCLYCNKTFYVTEYVFNRGGGKYCSKQCKDDAHKGKIVVTCLYCKKEFMAIPGNIKRGGDKYCSKKCFYLAINKRVMVECIICHKQFEARQDKILKGQSKCCSYVCMGKAKEGRDPNTPYKRLLRLLPVYKTWRKAVFERDKYTCRHCHKPSGRLNAHHIIPFSADASLLYSVDNGIALCEVCHRKEHKRLLKVSGDQYDIFNVRY